MDSSFKLVPLVVFLPVIGLLLNLLVGKRLGEIGAGLIASLATGGAFVVAVLLAMALSGHPEAVTVPLGNWITIASAPGFGGSLNVSWVFRVDTLSVTMMLVVAGVGTLIHIYAIGYMHSDVRHNGDPDRFRRFFVYLNLFIAAMMVLVSANNYLMLFVGWEGVGLCSYLLIGFWFEKGQDGIGNALAAKKAFVVNRIGDFGMLIAIFFIFWAFGTLDFNGVFENAARVSQQMPPVLLAITLFILLGVTGKSAQIPLFVWLPDAMAGPTPVSALIHAATMVTAGVYLIARSSPIYDLVPLAQNIVIGVGALTAFFAATIAVAQFDIKKVLAYSTISQLGFMVAAVGMGAYTAGMFHLVTHAFFKALLFLSAGSVILGMEAGEESVHNPAHNPEGSHTGHADHAGSTGPDPQDMRNMGGLQKRMKLTFWVYLAGALALSGIAPLSGFFSKDEILAAATRMPIVFVVLALAAFMTAFYMGRQIFMVFMGQPRTAAASHAKESAALVTMPLVVLAILSVLGGALNLPFGGMTYLEKWLEHTIEGAMPGEFIVWVALLSLGLALLGLFLAWMVYGRRSLFTKEGALSASEIPDPLAHRFGRIYRGLQNKWYVDEVYHFLVVSPYQSITAFFTQPLDLGVIDAVSNGLAKLTVWLAHAWSRLQNGFVRSYALAVALGLVVILGYLILRNY